MLIRFLRDYRGAATAEAFYEAGTEADLPDGAAIVAEGAAEVVTIDSRRGQVDPTDDEDEDEDDQADEGKGKTPAKKRHA